MSNFFKFKSLWNSFIEYVYTSERLNTAFNQSTLAAVVRKQSSLAKFSATSLNRNHFILRHKTWLLLRFFQRIASHPTISPIHQDRSYSSILSLTAEMCKDESMNRTKGMVRRRIMKMRCLHLPWGFRSALFIYPLGYIPSFFFFFEKSFYLWLRTQWISGN